MTLSDASKRRSKEKKQFHLNWIDDEEKFSTQCLNIKEMLAR